MEVMLMRLMSVREIDERYLICIHCAVSGQEMRSCSGQDFIWSENGERQTCDLLFGDT